MKFTLILLLIYQINETVSINCDLEPKTTEATLLKKLFCNKYDKSERPVKSHTDSINVNMHMVLQNFDFNDSLQKLFINVWLMLTWRDVFLTWNPMEYGEIKELVIDSEDIWLPDMMPYSAYYSNNMDAACTTPKCLLDSSGWLKCVPGCEYHSLCQSDFSNWPFDRQNCTLRFGMWAEHSKEVDFISNGTSFGSPDTNSHSEWKILTAKAEKHDSTHTLEGNKTMSYPSLIFNYILERHSGSHCAFVLTPAFVMVAINIISMGLSCYSLERLFMLGGNVFIHFVFIQSLYWQIPYNGSTVPSFLTFFRDSLVLSASLLVLTVFIKHLYSRELEAPVVLKDIASAVTGNQLGQWVFGTSSLDVSGEDMAENGYQNDVSGQESAGDTVVLVDESASEVKNTSGKSDAYKAVALIVDRFLFIGIVVAYILMLITLIPRY